MSHDAPDVNALRVMRLENRLKNIENAVQKMLTAHKQTVVFTTAMITSALEVLGDSQAEKEAREELEYLLEQLDMAKRVFSKKYGTVE